MSQIRSKDTDIEMILRSALWSMGYRYRLHAKDILGKPDIVFRKRKVAIFCDSSFWHGKHYTYDTDRIKTNNEYWKKKIKRNMERDSEVTKYLESQGWTVLRFWDDEILNNLEAVINKIVNTLGVS